MQRIDENTYIDDTLVTCAEYQLFIDEMHEQGKYYQPDHWNSYNFPAGHAREPVLGVRHSDAVEFCEWLTRREDRRWQYHLPIEKEALDYSMKSYVQAPLGYWIMGTDHNYQFAWSGAVPDDARGIAHALDLAFTNAVIRAISIALNLDLSLNYDVALALERDLNRIRGPDVNLNFNIALDVVHALTSNL